MAVFYGKLCGHCLDPSLWEKLKKELAIFVTAPGFGELKIRRVFKRKCCLESSLRPRTDWLNVVTFYGHGCLEKMAETKVQTTYGLEV